MSSPRHIETLAVHAGRGIDPLTGAVAPPIVLSTTFARGEDGELIGDYLYGRWQNPNREALERCIGALEGAARALCFASGCAAAQALFGALSPGDGLLLGDDLYFGMRELAREHARRYGLRLFEASLSDERALEQALAHEPRLVVCESPTNPLLSLVDIARLAERCAAAGAWLCVDNTFATPVLQQPLALGADCVLHSSTKYLSGHSDVTGGALCFRESEGELVTRALFAQSPGGAVPSPFDCWLLLRSIATLPLRVHAQVDRAEALASWLAEQPAVTRVLYPGLAAHPGHEIARRQMARPGAMLSILLAGEAAARSFCSRLSLATRATSLGSVHTLAEHRALVEGPGTRTPRELVRLSIGVEHLDDLKDDFAQALSN